MPWNSIIETITNLRRQRQALDNLRPPEEYLLSNRSEVNDTPQVDLQPPQVNTTTLDNIINNNEAAQERLQNIAGNYQEQAERIHTIAENITITVNNLETLIINYSSWVVAHPYQASIGLAATAGVLFMGFRFSWMGRIARFIAGPTALNFGNNMYQVANRRLQGNGDGENQNRDGNRQPVFNPNHPLMRYVSDTSLAVTANIATILMFLFRRTGR